MDLVKSKIEKPHLLKIVYCFEVFFFGNFRVMNSPHQLLNFIYCFPLFYQKNKIKHNRFRVIKRVVGSPELLWSGNQVDFWEIYSSVHQLHPIINNDVSFWDDCECHWPSRIQCDDRFFIEGSSIISNFYIIICLKLTFRCFIDNLMLSLMYREEKSEPLFISRKKIGDDWNNYTQLKSH